MSNQKLSVRLHVVDAVGMNDAQFFSAEEKEIKRSIGFVLIRGESIISITAEAPPAPEVKALENLSQLHLLRLQLCLYVITASATRRC